MVNIDSWVDTVDTILRVMEDRNRGTLVIKTLPTDNANVLNQLASGFQTSRLKVLTPDQPFQNLAYLCGADLALCIPSTFLAEAVALGVPSYTLMLGDVQNWYPVSPEHLELLNKIAPCLYSEVQLSEVVAKLIEGSLSGPQPDPAAFGSLFGQLDGGNLDRALNASRRVGFPLEFQRIG